jgi:hypothetical protein
MDATVPSQQLQWVLIPVAATACVALLAWLWVGRAPGARKRVVFRFALLGLTAFLLWFGRSQGVFAQSTPAFTVALGAIVLLIAVGNLYSVRFCTSCGRMHRNFKTLKCARCFAVLPQHGFTEAPRRPPIDPLDPLGRRGPAGRK